jgi:hypothetical protein
MLRGAPLSLLLQRRTHRPVRVVPFISVTFPMLLHITIFVPIKIASSRHFRFTDKPDRLMSNTPGTKLLNSMV